MIYLDNSATTFLDPDVLVSYTSLLQDMLGNPSSMHRWGQRAKHHWVRACRGIAHHLGVLESGVVMTSGATEALMMAIASCPQGQHIVTSSLEHAAVREAVRATGCEVTWLDPLPGCGAISPEQIETALQPHTGMIVVTAANNETGALSNLQAIAEIAACRDLLLVIDAVAWLGKERWWLPPGRVALALSGHKIHAPVGVGCLVLQGRFPLKPLFIGGGQQKNRRGGTEAVALTVAFECALERALATDYETIRRNRDRLEARLIETLPDVVVHCQQQPRASHVSNLSLPLDGETLLMKLDLAGVAASHGSACQTGALEPSHVLTRMGLPSHLVRRSLRFSLSRYTQEGDIDEAATRIIAACSSSQSWKRQLIYN